MRETEGETGRETGGVGGIETGERERDTESVWENKRAGEGDRDRRER